MSHGATPSVAKLAWESTIFPLLSAGFAISPTLSVVVGTATRGLIREAVVGIGAGAASSQADEFSRSRDTLFLFLDKPSVTF